MLTLVRAGLAAALLALALVPAMGQDAAKEKAFQSAPLDEAAVKLEAQIKTDAGKVTKPAAQLRKDADAAFQKNDYRAGMVGGCSCVVAGTGSRRGGTSGMIGDALIGTTRLDFGCDVASMPRIRS